MKQETINKIRALRKEGKKYREISRELGICLTSVIYNSSEENRQIRNKRSVDYFRNLSRERKKEIYRRRKPIILAFLNKKYKTDENFRKKRIEYSRNYYKRKKDGNKKT